jgi:hypothetical protein
LPPCWLVLALCCFVPAGCRSAALPGCQCLFCPIHPSHAPGRYTQSGARAASCVFGGLAPAYVRSAVESSALPVVFVVPFSRSANCPVEKRSYCYAACFAVLNPTASCTWLDKASTHDLIRLQHFLQLESVKQQFHHPLQQGRKRRACRRHRHCLPPVCRGVAIPSSPLLCASSHSIACPGGHRPSSPCLSASVHLCISNSISSSPLDRSVEKHLSPC